MVRSGVHFVVSDAHSGKCLADYDVCAACMDRYSPLIIPSEARRPGVTQVRVSYASFGGYHGNEQPHAGGGDGDGR